MKKIFTIVSLAAVGLIAMASVAAAQGVNVTVQAQMTARIARADQEIDRRVAALNNLAARVQAMQKVSADAKSKTATQIQAQLSALAALKIKIDADIDADVLHADVQSITDSYRIFALVLPQGYILAAADRIEVIRFAIEDLAVRMQARIDVEKAAGHDVSALVSAMADLNANLSNSNIQAQAAGTLVYNLTPDNGDQSKATANHAALVEARTHIRYGMQYLQTARKDVDTILKGLK